MTTNKIEQILIKAVLSQNLVQEEEILGIYVWGSRLFNTDNENSDLDYCIVVNQLAKPYLQIETENLDLHIITTGEYKKRLEECDDMALSMYFQRVPILEYKVDFNLNLQNLRKSISTKANNSFVNAKKKLIIKKDYDVRASIKSLFHSIRLLDFGTRIAYPIYDRCTDEINTYNQDLMGENIEWIEDVYRETDNNWEEIHKIFKPVYNTYATEFKKIVPKLV